MSSIALGSRLLAGPFSKMTGLNTLQGHSLLPPSSLHFFSFHPCYFDNVNNVCGEMTGLNILQGHYPSSYCTYSYCTFLFIPFYPVEKIIFVFFLRIKIIIILFLVRLPQKYLEYAWCLQHLREVFKKKWLFFMTFAINGFLVTTYELSF